MNGVLIIDKPEDCTSHDVVARLRRILKTKKIGHTGTLDPFATGVLVMLVGKATRLAKFMEKDEKEYEAVLRFGFETDTGDRTGEVRGESRKVSVEKEDIEKVLPDFTGEIEQVPPMYSAKKVKGKKLYELARKGIEIERKSVDVMVSTLEITDTDSLEEKQEAKILVKCSAGTYIRTLAEDIGRSIGVGCHLAELRRIQAGPFDISAAVSIEKLEGIVASGKIESHLISMNKAVSHLPEKIADDVDIEKLSHGMRIAAHFANADDREEVRISDKDDNLLAIGVFIKDEGAIQPKLVFV